MSYSYKSSFGINIDCRCYFTESSRSSISPLSILLSFPFAGQVDLWTKQQGGCSCSWDGRNSNADGNGRSDGLTATTKFVQQTEATPHDCACCVKGGCQCGPSLPARCGQCGLEQYCVNSEFLCINYVTAGIEFAHKKLRLNDLKKHTCAHRETRVRLLLFSSLFSSLVLVRLFARSLI